MRASLAGLSLVFLAQPSFATNPWCDVSISEARAIFATHPFSVPPEGTQAHALAQFHVEGTLPHQGDWDAAHFALHDLVLMRRAALAWRAGGDIVQFDVARRLLIAWADTYQPSLNPIDETDFDMLIDTFAILKDRLAATDSERVAIWLNKWGWAYVHKIARDARPDHTIWINNWQSHRIKLITLIAAATGDQRLFGEARRLFQRQIAANIHPDGETLDFYQRDALHYVVYDLEPLLRAALVARRFSDEDWYHWETRDHASLASAIAWLTPYASGRLRHEEFVHSKVDFDARRAAAGVRGFKGRFDARGASEVYWLASRFEPTLEPLARSLGPEPDYLSMCGN